MVNDKAQTAKDKGNAAFKTGNYPTAIGHYTTAILADATDPTYPLNRAAAYLKLGKNEDAERDCTTVLGLSKNNVKALFRRGQARVALGKLLEARKDFSDVLLVEPSSGTAQEEMKRVTILIQQEKAKKSKSPATLVQASLEPAAASPRRRVPIKIIDPSGKVLPTTPAVEATPPPPRSAAAAAAATAATAAAEALVNDSGAGAPPPPSMTTTSTSARKPSSLDTLEAASSRSLKPARKSSPPETASSSSDTPSQPPSTGNQPPPPPPQPSFSEVKASRESTRPSRIGGGGGGGGIFRASGESTLFTRNRVSDGHFDSKKPTSLAPVPQSLASSSSTLSPLKENGVTYEAPSTLFDFTRTWSSLISSSERWRYLNTIEPTSLPKLCQTSLEPSLLVSILETFLVTLSIIATTGNNNNNNNNNNWKSDITQQQQRALAYLDAFAKVPRFETVVLLLSRSEKEIARKVWELLGVDEPSGVWKCVAPVPAA